MGGSNGAGPAYFVMPALRYAPEKAEERGGPGTVAVGSEATTDPAEGFEFRRTWDGRSSKHIPSTGAARSVTAQSAQRGRDA